MPNIPNKKLSFFAGLRLFKEALGLTGQVYVRFLKDNLGLIAGFALGSEIMSQYFTYMDKMTSGNTSLNLPAKIGLFLTSLVMMVFYALIIPLRLTEYETGATRKSVWQFSQETLWPYTLESLRAIAKCLMMLVGGVIAGIALLFIFIQIGLVNRDELTNQLSNGMGAPGAALMASQYILPIMVVLVVMFSSFALFYLRYTFVPYIVLVDPNYKAGRVDALKRSFDLARGVTRYILLVLVVMTVFEVWRAKLSDEFTFMSSPVVAIIVLAVFETLTLYFNILLFRIYELRVKGNSQGA